MRRQCVHVRLNQYVNHDPRLIFKDRLIFKARLVFKARPLLAQLRQTPGLYSRPGFYSRKYGMHRSGLADSCQCYCGLGVEDLSTSSNVLLTSPTGLVCSVKFRRYSQMMSSPMQLQCQLYLSSLQDDTTISHWNDAKPYSMQRLNRYSCQNAVYKLFLQ